MSRFLITQNSSKTTAFIYDYEGQTIIEISKGNRQDITKKAAAMYNKDKNKCGNWRNGASWYENLLNNKNNNILSFDNKLELETDDIKEVSAAAYKIQIEQLQHIEKCGIKYTYI